MYDRRNPTGAPDAAALMVARSGALQPEGSVTGVNTTVLPSTHHMLRYGAAANDPSASAPPPTTNTASGAYLPPLQEGGGNTAPLPPPQRMGHVGSGGNPLAGPRREIQGAEKLMMNREAPPVHRALKAQADAMARQFEQSIKAPRFAGQR